ncbi:Uncharacterised protein [uncultured archaeon]|nr:Uncharacterised protein [uncultured archaeon]
MAKMLPMIGIMLLAFPLLFGATPVEKFISDSFEPDQQVQSSAITGGYTVISVGGVETYVIDSSGKAVKDKATLQSVLEADAKSAGGFDAKVSSAQSFATEVSDAKQVNEAKCLQYLGLNMYNCTDKQSCIVACFAVPQCNLIINADGFVEAMMDYNSKRLQYATDLSSFSGNIDAIGMDTSAVDQKLSVLNDMGTLASSMAVNSIFLNRTDEQCQGGNAAKCFEYCPKIDYSSSRIESQKQNLQALKAAVASISQQAGRADAILAKSKANDDYLSTRESNFDSFRLKMLGDIADLKSKNTTFSKSVKDANASAMLSSLSNLSSAIIADGDAGYYRRATARRAEYDSAEKSVSDLMDSELAQYNNMTADMASMETNLGKSAWIIGNASVANYTAQLAQIKLNATAPATIQQIVAARAALASMGLDVAKQVASAATENPQAVAGAAAGAAASQAKGSLPCMPAFAVLAVLGFAFSRKR